jgi:tetratricopeptide (TPR) repeat protein
MVRKIFYTLLCVFLFTACASLPEEEYQQAQENREIIAKHELNTYFPEKHAEAEERFVEGESNYDKDNAKSKEAFDAANALYQDIIKQAYPLRVNDTKSTADSSRNKAKNIKADVAVKNDFIKADEEYQKALALSEEGNYEEALVHLKEAQTLFEGAFEAAKAKYDKAKTSIDSAQQQIDKVDEMIGEIEGAPSGDLEEGEIQ